LNRKKDRNRAAKRTLNAVRESVFRRRGCAIISQIASTVWTRRIVTVSRADKYFSVGVTGKQPRRDEISRKATEQMTKRKLQNLRLHPRYVLFACDLRESWVLGPLIACIETENNGTNNLLE